MSVKNCWGEVMALLRRGGSVTELSVTDGSLYGAVMKQVCPVKFRDAGQYSSHSETC